MRPVVVAVAVLIVAAIAAWASGLLRLPTTDKTSDERTQQTVGESTAGRSQNMPAGQASDRAGADETGVRSQAITRSASSEMPLSPDQVSRVKSYFGTNPPNRSSTTFSVTIGSSVPREVHLEPLPPELVDIMHKYRGDEYLMIENRLIVAEPKSRRIVAIVPL